MITRYSETLEVAKRFVEALTRRDVAMLNSLLHDEAVVEFPFPLVEGENLLGAARSTARPMLAFVASLEQSNSQVRFHNIIWRTTSDGLALFQGDEVSTLADGRSFSNHLLMFFEVSNGKVSRWREYLDPSAGSRSVGLLGPGKGP